MSSKEMTWDAAAEHAEAAAEGSYLKLEPGQKALIMILGMLPVVFEVKHWADTNNGRESFDCEGAGCPHCAQGIELSKRYRLPLWVRGRGMATWEVGPKWLKALNGARKRCQPECYIEIERQGSGTKTNYACFPMPTRLSDEEKVAIDAAVAALSGIPQQAQSNSASPDVGF